MMERKAFADKIFCIGIDGMDPRLTRKYVDEGKMPNVKSSSSGAPAVMIWRWSAQCRQ